MVFYESHYAWGVFIEVIVAQRIVDAVKSLPPIVGFLVLRHRKSVEESKVHNGLQVAVLFREFTVLLPCCRIGRLCYPRFAHSIEVWIFHINAFHPRCHCFSVGIGVGVHSNAVYSDSFYPPYWVLNEVLHHVRIAMIEVGHRTYEPAVYRFCHIYLTGIGVEYRCQLVRSLQPIVRIVEPILCRNVPVPQVIVAAMVENHIHYHFQTAFVACICQCFVVAICTKTRVYAVVIGCSIAVVGAEFAAIGRAVIL